MKLKQRSYNIAFLLIFFILFAILWSPPPTFSYPVIFTDSDGNIITIEKRPSGVVSLVPAITEIIFKLGAGDAVKAVTYHDTYPPEAATKEIVGGFFSPSLRAIKKIEPDVIFVSRLHKRIREKFGYGRCRLINLEANSISDIYANINLLGRIFNREKDAARIIDEIKNELLVIARKVAGIPQSERKRVIRLMGRDQVMTPGDDSFQNEYIRLAGGIPPRLGKDGSIAAVTKEEWMRFNPQIIYGCGGDRETAKKFFDRPGWRDVEAVRNDKIFFFPCDLTCRASTRAGYFVSWLSARIYEDKFSKKEEQVFKDRVFRFRRLDLDLDYIRDVRISCSTIHDFSNKTLIIDFTKPLSLVSTLEGERRGIESIGNHYSSPPCWGIGHKLGLEEIRKRAYEVIGKSEDTASFLFTGADMDNLAIKKEGFRDMEVYALVTAGVKSNAVRMSADEGRFYEPGTINIIILSNMKLSPRAMTRAIISATEAKTAALQDLDIRSSYTPRIHQATGTGTDNIIVVEGDGIPVDNSGGHTKMGELIARAVYEAVQEAVYRQNGIVAQRNIFQRLKDRKISFFDLITSMQVEDRDKRKKILEALKDVLLQPRYASFVESSFAISDDYEKGLIADLSSHELSCKKVAEEIAGKEIANLKEVTETEDVPLVLRMTVNTLLNGIYYRIK